ncbi:MAG: hypothetical protein ACLU9X_10370 [Alistipes shahii]
MLVTGSRLADGSVLANVSFFVISPNRTTETDLPMRDNSKRSAWIGEFQLRIEIHRRPTGRRLVVARLRDAAVISWSADRRRAGTHRSCAEGHRRQGRRAWKQWGRSTSSPALPRRGGVPRNTRRRPRPRCREPSPSASTATASVRRRILDAMQLPWGTFRFRSFSIGDHVQPRRVRIPRLHDRPRRPSSFAHHTPL